MFFRPILVPVTLLMIYGVFVASYDTFIKPFLEQRLRCGASNLFVIFEMFYDLWIPVIKTPDTAWFVIVFSGTRGRTQFKGFFDPK